MLKFTIRGDDAYRAVKRLLEYTAREGMRPVLEGAQVRVDGESVRFTAADGFHLLTTRVDAMDTSEGDSFILRRDDLDAIRKALPGGEQKRAKSTVTIEASSLDEPRCFYITVDAIPAGGERTQFPFDPIDGAFIKYQQLIPAALRDGEHGTREIAVAGRLLIAIGKAAALSDGESGAATLLMPDGASAPVTAVITDKRAETVIVAMPMFVDVEPAHAAALAARS